MQWIGKGTIIGIAATLFAVGLPAMRPYVPVGGIALVGSSGSPFKQDDFENRIKPILEENCFDCHSGPSPDGSLDLTQFASQASVEGDLPNWFRVLKVLEHEEMPPAEGTPLAAESNKMIQHWLVQTIEESSRDRSNPFLLKRLNRIEYENTIRDVFRLTRDCFDNPSRITLTNEYFRPESKLMPRHVFAKSVYSTLNRRHNDLPGLPSIPIDSPAPHGFTNDQTALSTSPLLVDVYLEVIHGLLQYRMLKFISTDYERLFHSEPESDRTLQMKVARERLASFLRRAFRRPVEPREVDRYEKIFSKQLESSGSFEQSMKTTLQSILASPKFLFRDDFLTDKETEESYSQYQLASRLSYFLWATMPDDDLMQAAEDGKLNSKRQVRDHVRRMLLDPKIKSLASDFGMQWLKSNKAISAQPDRGLFPDYYVRPSEQPMSISMLIESLLLFETVLVEDRDILDFISADFAYLNRSLMDFYQLDPQQVAGFAPDKDDFEDFYRIRWPDSSRGGIVGSGVMLLSTSLPNRTSPVFRGTWFCEVVFNRPPPPPPANVPTLVENEGLVRGNLNVRDRLAEHRKDPNCASCHNRIDPMGLMLENYDPVGRWRVKYNDGSDVVSDASIGEKQIKNPSELKQHLISERTRFIKAFVEHLMRYALGRPLIYADEPEIRKIVAKFQNENARIQSIIEEIALSPLFLEGLSLEE